jgi:hypothetical protein
MSNIFLSNHLSNATEYFHNNLKLDDYCKKLNIDGLNYFHNKIEIDSSYNDHYRNIYMIADFNTFDIYRLLILIKVLQADEIMHDKIIISDVKSSCFISDDNIIIRIDKNDRVNKVIVSLMGSINFDLKFKGSFESFLKNKTLLEKDIDKHFKTDIPLDHYQYNLSNNDNEGDFISELNNCWRPRLIIEKLHFESNILNANINVSIPPNYYFSDSDRSIVKKYFEIDNYHEENGWFLQKNNNTISILEQVEYISSNNFNRDRFVHKNMIILTSNNIESDTILINRLKNFFIKLSFI